MHFISFAFVIKEKKRKRRKRRGEVGDEEECVRKKALRPAAGKRAKRGKESVKRALQVVSKGFSCCCSCLASLCKLSYSCTCSGSRSRRLN